LALAQTLGTPRPWTPAVVKLVSPGKAPLKLLQLKLKAGPPVKMVGEAWGTWETTNPVRPMRQRFPRQSTPFTVQVQSATTAALVFQAASAVPPENSFIDPYTQAMLAALEGVNGTLTLDASGNALRYAVYPSPTDETYRATPKQVSQGSFMAMEVTRGLITHLVLPLPAAPIGVGAVWKVERYVQRGMLAFLEAATVTLEKVEGPTLTLKYTLSARPDPGLKAQASELKSLVLTGEGTATLRLDAPLPTAQSDDFTLEASITSVDGSLAQHHAQLHTGARLVVE
jgi:hypothetical protein